MTRSEVESHPGRAAIRSLADTKRDTLVMGIWSVAAVWVGALGTVGALFTALIQIERERRLRKKAEQATATSRRRSQAELISAWWSATLGEGRDRLVVLNQSYEPVYMAVMSLVLVQGAGPVRGEDLNDSLRGHQVCLSVVPPGRWQVMVAGGWGGMHRRPGAEVAFTDCRGRHWIRRALGNLEEIQEDAATHLGIVPPDLQVPEPYDAS